MKIYFGVINRIPRLILRYKGLSTNNQLAYKEILIPARPKSILIGIYNSIMRKDLYNKDELGIILSHDRIYNYEDRILAVGVGSGISLIHNCKKSRIDNSFIGIEASTKVMELAKMNAALNGVEENKYILINKFAGIPTNVYNSQSGNDVTMIDINELEFDVLELDCEGSEIEILESLKVNPRHIIVEMHPMFRKIDLDKFLSMMETKNYELAFVYSVFGDEIDKDNIRSYFSDDHIISMMKYRVSWGDGLLVFNFNRIEEKG